MNKLWDEIDNIQEEIDSRFKETDYLPVKTPVRFRKKFSKKVGAGTKAIVLDRMGDYYAVAVKGNYIEGIHKSFLKEIE